MAVGRTERRQSFKTNRVLASFHLLRVYSHVGEKRFLTQGGQVRNEAGRTELETSSFVTTTAGSAIGKAYHEGKSHLVKGGWGQDIYRLKSHRRLTGYTAKGEKKSFTAETVDCTLTK